MVNYMNKALILFGLLFCGILKIQAQQHDPVTAIAISDVSTDKKGNKIFKAKTPDDKELIYKILSEEDKILAVVKGKYRETEYIIPEYVDLNQERYSVVRIDDEAFIASLASKYRIDKIQLPYTIVAIGKHALFGQEIDSIVFPEGLKEIEESAFSFTWLKSIILPNSIEVIGKNAFMGVRNRDARTSSKAFVEEIHIPKTIKSIGVDCFKRCGRAVSPRLLYQGYISSLPPFITESNCSEYGIDDAAVRAYNETFTKK